MTTDVAIAVPIRDEGAHLPRLLDAIAGQVGAPSLAVCLWFDGCTDGGPAIATAMAAELGLAIHVAGVAASGPANAGLARRHACAAALERMPGAALLTTDADTVPAPDWVAASLAGLTAAAIVAGRIEPEHAAGSAQQQRLGRYLDRLHRLRRAIDPVPWEDAETHHWTSAASLAFAPGVYAELGGFAPLARGEDADLADRAWRAGIALRRDARVRVTTSTRRGGRAAGGFASLLAALDVAGAMPSVAHPADEAWRYRLHVQARRCWSGVGMDTLALAVDSTPAALAAAAAAAPNAEAFTARVIGTPGGGMRPVTLAEAEAILPALEADAMAIPA